MNGDLISRQAAIDALEREKSLVERPITETRWFDLGLGKAQDVLSGLPSAQQWIPCSERLPEKSGSYIVIIKNNKERFVNIAAYISTYISAGWLTDANIIAWMPLPEPWEGEEG